MSATSRRDRDRQAGPRSARFIEIVAWSLVLFGAALPMLLQTSWFAGYRDALAAGVGVQAFADHARLTGLVAGIAGGSIAGLWTMAAAIAHFGLTRGQSWARNALLIGLGTWLAVDIAGSLAAGAWWNPVMLDSLPLVLAGAPLALAWRALGAHASAEPAHPALAAPVRAVTITSALGVASGLVIAFAGHTILFEPWFAGLSASGIESGPVTSPVKSMAGSFFGLIGGCVAGQFAMILLVARGPMRAGARWAAPACMASVLVWFVVDSSYGLVHGGLFNVLMVNVPTLVLTVPPLVWVHIRVRRVVAGR